jgi:hypothetical protein
MPSLDALRSDWREGARCRPIEPVMTMSEEGLVLGGAVLAKMSWDQSGTPQLAIDGAEQRILALLAAAYQISIGPEILGNIRRAAREWRRGETCVAQMHLAHGGLPRLRNKNEAAFRLFLGEVLLAHSLTPRELVKACGLDAAFMDLLKAEYSPDQPRVPAGNSDGGQWTSADGSPDAANSAETPIIAGRRSAADPSPSKVNPVEPPLEVAGFQPVHRLPDDAVIVTTPDGKTIADPDSKTKKLMAPPRADFREVYAAGQAIAFLSLSEQYQMGHDAIAQGGTYDFQRDAPNEKFYDAYVRAANYAVGVYMAGAGYSLPSTLFLAKLYALKNSTNYNTQDQEHWIKHGWADGKSGVWR